MADTLSLPAVISTSQIETGMTIRVHQKIKDVSKAGEDKERVQVFEGIVVVIKGNGVSKTMTIRKISDGYGVERIFPLTLPSIVKIELTKKHKVRRNNISFIRETKKRLREVKNIVLKTV